MLNNITLILNASNLDTFSPVLFPQSKIIGPGWEILCDFLKQQCCRPWDVKKRKKKSCKLSHLMTVCTCSTFMLFHFVLTKLINTTKPWSITLTSVLVGRPVSCRPSDWLLLFFFIWKASNKWETWKERTVWGVRGLFGGLLSTAGV